MIDNVMERTSRTSGGTIVVDLDAEDYRQYLDSEVQASLGMSADDFRAQARAGTVNWDDPDAMYVAGLLGVDGAQR
jgi:hypothetical protein